MQPVILDADVASLSHKRKLAGPLATRLTGRRPLITFVTFGELTKWAEVRAGRPRDRSAGGHAVRSASVGERRAARLAGYRPAMAPMARAAPIPPYSAAGGISSDSCWVRA